MTRVPIHSRLSIPEEELVYVASRAGGPGGQHVNKVSTRITLQFDVEGSPSLSAAQKARLRQVLATRINRDGVLRVACGRHRSQAANRAEALERFAGLLRRALARRKRRRATAVPAAEKRKRLEQKRRRARLKRERAKRGSEES
jgi:ribosome-associated protein